jgi:hypothetical protein
VVNILKTMPWIDGMQINLPPDLMAFIAENSGEGSHFRSADEFIAAVLQEKRERLEGELDAIGCLLVSRQATPQWWNSSQGSPWSVARSGR